MKLKEKFDLNQQITDAGIIKRLNDFLTNTTFRLKTGGFDGETYSTAFYKIKTTKDGVLMIILKVKEYGNTLAKMLFSSFIKGIISGREITANIMGEKEKVTVELMNKNRNRINYIIEAYQDENVKSYGDLIDLAEKLSISNITMFSASNSAKDSILSEANLEWLDENISAVRVMIGYNTDGKDAVSYAERNLQKDFPDLDLDDPSQVTYYDNMHTERGKAIKGVQMYIAIPAKNLQDAPKVIKDATKNGMILQTNLVWEICRRAQKLDLDNLYPGFRAEKPKKEPKQQVKSEPKENQLEKDVKSYFKSIKNPTQYSTNALVFGYINGMNPADCEDMQIEPEFTQEQEDEYYDVENIILNLLKSNK